MGIVGYRKGAERLLFYYVYDMDLLKVLLILLMLVASGSAFVVTPLVLKHSSLVQWKKVLLSIVCAALVSAAVFVVGLYVLVSVFHVVTAG